MDAKHESIIDLPHHVSAVRPQMDIIDRAAQFAPFAALSAMALLLRKQPD